MELPEVPKGGEFRDWCWTLFLIQQDKRTKQLVPIDPTKWLEFLETNSKYTVFQEEICPDTGRPHLQGYSEFPRSTRFARLKEVCDTVHLEKRNKPREKAREYCMKSDTRAPGEEPVEFGEFTPSGAKGHSSYQKISGMIEEGANVEDIANEYPVEFARYWRGLTHAVDLRRNPVGTPSIREWEKIRDPTLYADPSWKFNIVYYRENKFKGLVAGAKKVLLICEEELPEPLMRRLQRPIPYIVESDKGSIKWNPQDVKVFLDLDNDTFVSPRGGNTILDPPRRLKKKVPKKKVDEENRLRDSE